MVVFWTMASTASMREIRVATASRLKPSVLTTLELSNREVFFDPA